MEINFEAFPFTGFDDFTNEELEGIWMNIYKNSKLPEHITVKMLDKTDHTTKIIVSKNEDSKNIEILYDGADIFIDNTLFRKIYCIEQLNNIIYKIQENDKYDLKINHDENLIYNQSKIISIEINSRSDLEDENIKKYITREYDYKIKDNNMIEMDKSILSLYFDNIIKDTKTNVKFKIIINENRIKLIEKINHFWFSDDIFYIIMGTDGIGKTTTLLLFSSYAHYSYRFLYLNLKLFFGKTKKEVKDIFCDEIKRIFFVGKNFFADEMLNIELKKYKKLKSLIFEEIEKNKMLNNMNSIEYMWLLLQTLITLVNQRGLNLNILIILDQYKCNNIDIKYEGLNNTCSLILQNNKYSHFYKIRLLIVISINNYDTKKMFLENLSITYFDLNNNKLSSINKNKENNNNEKDKNYELIDIEEFLNDKIERINKIFNKYISSRDYNYNSDSLCFLFLFYRSITRKEYLNYNCICKELIDEDL